MARKRITFQSAQGHELAANLELPDGEPIACAIFAHCFTCSKDHFAPKRVSLELAKKGIAVFRFDFTGLGRSEGDFAETTFSGDVDDLVQAANYLRENYSAPEILIGHSLGGAAVLRAAHQIPEIKAIATIGAPAEVDHVSHLFDAHIDEIEERGKADVNIGGRPFTIKKEFLDDLREQTTDEIKKLKSALLVMHAPGDQIVGIENAAGIFKAAKHPKSFVSLDTADHLLTAREDAEFVANIVASWAVRYISSPQPSETNATELHEDVLVSENGKGKFQNDVVAGKHKLLADEPTSVGGDDLGPSPYDLLLASLGACTSMTLRMYADRKGLDVKKISIALEHDKVHAKDCEACEQKSGKVDVIRRKLTIEGDLTEEQRQRMLEIADRCPVHRTLEGQPLILTEY